MALKRKKNHFVTSKATVEALRKLHTSSGGLLLPETVVDAARNPKSPLHRHFEWDNTVAAERWRIEQARRLLRVTVEILQVEGSDIATRVYVSLSNDQEEEGGYRLTTDVMSDAELRTLLLQDALRDIEVFKTRYGRLKELALVIRAMNKIKI